MNLKPLNRRERAALTALLGDTDSTSLFIVCLEQQMQVWPCFQGIEDIDRRCLPDFQALSNAAGQLRSVIEGISDDAWTLITSRYLVENMDNGEERDLPPINHWAHPFGRGEELIEILTEIEDASSKAAKDRQKLRGGQRDNVGCGVVSLVAVLFKEHFPLSRVSPDPDSKFFKALCIFLPDRLGISPASLRWKVEQIPKDAR